MRRSPFGMHMPACPLGCALGGLLAGINLQAAPTCSLRCPVPPSALPRGWHRLARAAGLFGDRKCCRAKWQPSVHSVTGGLVRSNASSGQAVGRLARPGVAGVEGAHAWDCLGRPLEVETRGDPRGVQQAGTWAGTEVQSWAQLIVQLPAAPCPFKVGHRRQALLAPGAPACTAWCCGAS